MLLRCLLLADLHGNNWAMQKIVQKCSKIHYDMVLIAGDLPITTPPSLMARYITNNYNLSRTGYSRWVYWGAGRSAFIRYQRRSISQLLTTIKQLSADAVYYTPGNVDLRESLSYIHSFDPLVEILNYDLIQKSEYSIVGLGGSLVHIGEGTCDGEYTEEEIKRKIHGLEDKANFDKIRKPVIVIMHEPPRFSQKTAPRLLITPKVTYKYPFKVEGGSNSTTDFIKRINPLISVAGHYHEYPGIIKVGRVPVIIPGCVASYQFVDLQLCTTSKKVRWKFYQLQPAPTDYIYRIYAQRHADADM